MLTKHNADELLDEARFKSKRELEGLLAARFEKPAVPNEIRKLPRKSSEHRTDAPVPLAFDAPAAPSSSARPSGSGAEPRPERRFELKPAASPSTKPSLDPLGPARYKLQLTAGQLARLLQLVVEKRVMRLAPQRFERFGLRLHPDKIRLLPFARPKSGQTNGKGPATFDFLGFTVHWRKSRRGQWTPALKTRRSRLRRAITALAEFCRRHRHLPVKQQHASLVQRINGHYNYFGVNGNSRSLVKLLHYARRAWRKWLSRRSQRAYLSWKRFLDLERDYPLPRPTIRVQLWRIP